MKRAMLASLAAILVSTAAPADDEVLTYQELSQARTEHEGKAVRFRFTFQRLDPGVPALLGARGITDRTHVAVHTPPRPLREGGPLLILASRRQEALVKALQALGPGTEVVFSGRVLALVGDTGSSHHYVDLSGVGRAEEDEPPPDSPRTEDSQGYDEVATADVLRNPARYDGRKIRVVVSFGGLERSAPVWACELLEIEPDEAGALEGLPRLALVLPRSRREIAEVLRDLEPGAKIEVDALCRVEGSDRSTRIALRIDGARPAEGR